jgi:hypothetical protein
VEHKASQNLSPMWASACPRAGTTNARTKPERRRVRLNLLPRGKSCALPSPFRCVSAAPQAQPRSRRTLVTRLTSLGLVGTLTLQGQGILLLIYRIDPTVHSTKATLKRPHVRAPPKHRIDSLAR